MKKVFSLLIVLPLLFTGCKDDNDSNGNPSIVGRWNAEKAVVNEEEFIDEDVLATFIQFNADGTCTGNIGDPDDDPWILNYVFANNTLTLSASGQTGGTIPVIKLTETELVLNMPVEESDGTTTYIIWYFKKAQ